MAWSTHVAASSCRRVVVVVPVVAVLGVIGCSSQDSGGVTTPSSNSDPRPPIVTQLVERSMDMTQPYWSGYVSYSSSGTVWSDTLVIDPNTTWPTHTYPVSVPLSTQFMSIGFGYAGTPVVVLHDTEPLEPDAPANEQATTAVLENGVGTLYAANGQVYSDLPAAGESPISVLDEVAQAVLWWNPGSGPQFSRVPDGSERTPISDTWRDSSGFRVRVRVEDLRLAKARGPLERIRVRTSERYRQDGKRLVYVGGSRSTVSLDDTRPSEFEERWNVSTLAGGTDLPTVIDTLASRRAKHGAEWAELAEAAARDSKHRHAPFRATTPVEEKASSGCTLGTQSVAGADPQEVNAIILQHGINSDNCTWQRIVPQLSPAMAASRIVTTHTGSFDALNAQALTLAGSVVALHPESNPYGESRYRFAIVGHSQGGLVARTVAGWAEEAEFSWISGVVTLNTPNHGAIFAQGYNAVTGLSTMLVGAETVFTYGLLSPLVQGAGLLGPAVGLTGPITRTVACAIKPLFCDLAPGSAHLTNLNAASVSYRRTAIVQDVRRRWSGFRWMGDSFFCGGEVTDESCGPRLVHRVEYLNRSFRNCAKVSAVLGLFVQQLLVLSAGCARNVAALETADRVWNHVVAPSRPSDGFIGADQQWYPGVSASQQYYYAATTPSHAGLTRHRFTAGKICRALVERLQVRLASERPCPQWQ